MSILAVAIAFCIANFVTTSTEAQQARPEAESARVVSTDPTPGASFGSSVAIDGETLVVGSPSARNPGGSLVGAVYVYTRMAGAWTLQSKLVQPDPTINPAFGNSVAIKGDTLAVGAFQDDIGINSNQGSVYIFSRTGSDWTLQQKLTPSDDRGGLGFGSAISLEENWVAIGAYRGMVDGISRGSAYVFEKSGGSWSQSARLIESSGNQFGTSISTSGDTIVVGDMFASVNGSTTGAAFVYVRKSNSWNFQMRVVSSNLSFGDQFGIDVAVDGDNLLVGAKDHILIATSRCGAAYLFRRINGVWVQQQEFSDPVPNLADFGGSVAISGDRLIIGDSRISVDGRSAQGSAYVYIRNGSSWELQNKLVSSDGRPADFFGTDVAMSGKNFFVGAAGVDLIKSGSNEGAVYFYIQAPRQPDLQSSVDLGVSSSDNITNSTTLVFDMNGVTPGATVELMRNGTLVGNQVAVENSVSFTDVPPSNNTYQYTARETIAGITSSLSQATAVTVDTVPPSVWVHQGPTQNDPTNSGTVYFRLHYLEGISGFEANDLSFEGSTANITNATISHSNSPVSDSLRVDGVISDGQTVKLSLPAGRVADLAGNPNVVNTDTDNVVTVDNVRPTLTINQNTNQADPATSLPLRYSAGFSEPVTGFTSGVTLVAMPGSTSGATVNISGSGSVYEITVSNLHLNGSQVRVDAFTNDARDALGNGAMGSTSTDNFIFLDNVGPTVSVFPAVGQQSPTSDSTINYRVVFNEAVTDFSASDISLATSTANVSGANISITGGGTTYNVAVSNFVSNGQTVRVGVVAGATADSFGNPSTSSNVASVTADNTAPTVSIEKALSQPDPTSIQPIRYSILFSEPVTGLTVSDLSFAGSIADTSLANVVITGSGSSYTATVRNIISSGTVQLSLGLGAATDSLGNLSLGSNSIDNTVALEVPAIANISGRVTSLDGRGLARVRVQIRLTNGTQLFAQTNPFGYYRVANVPTGLVTINVARKNTPPTSETFYLLNESVNNFSFSL